VISTRWRPPSTVMWSSSILRTRRARYHRACEHWFCGGTTEKLDVWLNDARKCNICGTRRLARTLRQKFEAVRKCGGETLEQ
jgi:hypothetical protein